MAGVGSPNFERNRKSLEYRKDDFCTQTHRQTLHHYIYTIIITMTVASSMAPYPTKPLNKQEVWGWKRGGLSLEGKDDYKGWQWEHWSKWYVSLILFSAFREKLFRDSSEIFEFIPCVFLLFEPGHHAGKSGVGEGEVVLKARRGEECGNGGFMQRLSTKLKYYSWHPPRVSESDWAEKKYSWEWLKLQRKTQKLWDATVEEYHHKTLSSIWPSLAGRSHPNCLLILNWIGIFTQN